MRIFAILMTSLSCLALVQPASAQTLEERACEDIAAWHEAVEDADRLPADASFEEFQRANNRMEESFVKARESATAARPTEVRALQRAFDRYVYAVEKVPETSTIEEARAAVSQEREDLRLSYRDLILSLNCITE